MKQLPPSLEAHLKSGATTLCTCWKITRNDGTIMGFSDHDNDLEFDSITYEAATGLTGSEAVSRVGLSVDNLEIHSALSSQSLTDEDLSNGLYDNAKVEVFLVNWSNPTDNLLLRTGNVGEVKRGSLSFIAEVRGISHHLQQPQGRQIQSICDADLGDARCKVNLANPAFWGIGEIAELDGRVRFRVINIDGFSDGWFSGGSLEWLSGINVGAKIEIKSHQNKGAGDVWLETWHAPANPPAPSDQFNITAGCNKAFSTCRQKFTNQVNFRGFPHVPGNDFIITSPSSKDGNLDGSSLN